MAKVHTRLKELHKKNAGAGRHSSKPASDNPFEAKFTRQKHLVLNRKVKGSRGRPGLTRKKSEEARNAALKPELKTRGKESSFVDRRFGENDPTMSVEDKMMARLIQEKSKRSSKSSLYNLEEEDELTHMGQSLNDLDDMDDGTFFAKRDSEDEDGQLDKHTVARANFGGFGDEEESDRKKTKAEIMKEIIAKSKFHKAERQRVKDENEELMEEVDQELDSVRELLNSEYDEIQAKRRRATDEYDQFVKELRFDKRSKPSDRTKTEEEIALEEKQKLEALEAERIKRMQFPDLTADSSVDAIGDGNKKKRNKQKRAPQADDLDMWVDDGVGQEAPILEYKDGVLVGSEIQQDEEGQSEGSDEEEEEDEESEEEGDVDDEEESGSDDDEEESTDESDVEEELLDKNNTESSKQSTDALEKLRNCGFIASSDEEEGEEDDNDTITNVPVPKTGSKTKATSATAESSKSLSKKKSSSESPSSTSTSSLPFVFPAPNNYSDLLVLIKDRNAQDCDTIFQRLRTLYNVSLSSENKDKLKTLLKVMLIHLQKSSCKQHSSSANVDSHMNYLNILMSHIQPLCRQFADWFSGYAKERLMKMQELLKHQASQGMTMTLPDMGDILFLRLITQIYSTSDFQHAVITPALLLMGQYLCMCPVTSETDALVGLSISQILFKCHEQSKRLQPEVVSYLLRIVTLLSNNGNGDGGCGGEHVHQDDSWFDVKEVEASAVNGPIDGLIASLFMKSEPETKRMTVLLETLKSIKLAASSIYSESPSYIELFQPFSAPITRIVETLEPLLTLSTIQGPTIDDEEEDEKDNSSSVSIKEILTGAIASVSVSTAQLKRKPLQLQKRKPVPIPTYVPKFAVNYSIDKHYDPNRERAQTQKTTRQYKKEFKGAARELRKDADYIARQKLQETRAKDAQYKRKIDGIMGQLAQQEGAMRGYEREQQKRKKKF